MKLKTLIAIFGLFMILLCCVNGAGAVSHDVINDTVAEADLQDGSVQVNDENKAISEFYGNFQINESLQSTGNSSALKDSRIESKNVNTYYKENSELAAYLKDSNSNPISNRNVQISLNNKIYDKITDASGKVVLKLNLKPDTYKATIKFAGDENYTSSITSAVIKVKNTSLNIATKNYKTYFESDLFFRAKVINKVTKNPVKDVKVTFKVYTAKNKFRTYYSTTDSKGIAKLKKNFAIGHYKVVTSIKKNKYLTAKKSEASLTVKPTAETGCTSLYVQVSNTEAVTGFRRDATNAKDLHIVKYKLNGIAAVKQYKKNSYFFHSITAANGWMAGTGGMDNPTINQAIEKLAGKMFKAGKIEKSYLKTIQGYERQLGIGHFSIKAPNGKYAVVWASGIEYGKLKPGQYLKAPNARSLFYKGTYSQFSKNPYKAAIKIAASDSFGINRRDATAFHWKAATVEGKTTSKVKVYAANDNGRLVGSDTGYLMDNIYFNGKYISKYSLPKTPSSKFLGTFDLGNIDKLIKTGTVVDAPKIVTFKNESKAFKVTVKNKSTKKAIKNLVVKVKAGSKTYSIKTNKKGVAQFNTKLLDVGYYRVVLFTDNIKYKISAKSKILIKE